MCLLLQAQPGGEKLRQWQQGTPGYQVSLRGVEALAGGCTTPIHHSHRPQKSTISARRQET